MFLRVEGIELPEPFVFQSMTNDPDETEDRCPAYLVPLEKADWPREVKARIVELYEARGLPKPLKTKLVNPYAIAFGGQKNKGAYDFSGVDWDFVIDYYEWEAASMSGNREESREIMQKIKAKWGMAINHYPVYEDYDSYKNMAD